MKKSKIFEEAEFNKIMKKPLNIGNQHSSIDTRKGGVYPISFTNLVKFELNRGVNPKNIPEMNFFSQMSATIAE